MDLILIPQKMSPYLKISRRDLSVNTMAIDKNDNLIDPTMV